MPPPVVPSAGGEAAVTAGELPSATAVSRLRAGAQESLLWSWWLQ